MMASYLKKIKSEVLFGTAVGFFAYFYMISQNLRNNFDGLWWISAYNAGAWECSIGRWVWPVLDLARFGIVSVVLNSVLTVLLITIADILILDVLKVSDKKIRYLFQAAFLVTPLVCDMLGYTFMSPTFGAAYLFAVLMAAAVLKIASPVKAIAAGALFTVLTMGCYQAYIGVSCTVFLFAAHMYLIEVCGIKDLLKITARFAAAFLLGGIIYKIAADAACAVWGIELSSYNGANCITVGGIIANLPHTAVNVYKCFWQFFFGSVIQKNYFGLKYLNTILFALSFAVFAAGAVRVYKKSAVNLIPYLVFTALLPAAANAAMIIAYESRVILQMEAALVLLPGLVLCLSEKLFSKPFAKRIMLTAAALMLWINVFTVQNDQLAMGEGRNAVMSIANYSSEKLIDSNLLTEDRTVAFIGRPSANPYFYRSTVWERANEYAQVGKWWIENNCSHYSWQGIIKGYGGINFNFCSEEVYENLISGHSEELAQMPCYPEEGFMRVIGGTVVLKISGEFMQ